MERVKGIEPSSSAWKAEVLPLNYTRLYSETIYSFSGREDRIRTYDPLVPNQVLYQAELLPGGAPERSRTPSLLIRSQTLYPIELQALYNRTFTYYHICWNSAIILIHNWSINLAINLCNQSTFNTIACPFLCCKQKSSKKYNQTILSKILRASLPFIKQLFP